MARNGKIARMSLDIRNELNRRLQDGESGITLLKWLNRLPAVQAMLARDFEGVPVSNQNLSDWRRGGFAQWQAQRELLEEARETAADASELKEATDGCLTDHLATVLAARYAAALAGWDGETSDDFRHKLRTLRGLCQDIVELRRGDHSGARLKMEQERLTREQEKTEEEVVAHFQKWLKNPDVRDAVCQNYVSSEERERRMRAIFGLEPKPEPAPEEAAQERGDKIGGIFGMPPEAQEQCANLASDGTESNPVKPKIVAIDA